MKHNDLCSAELDGREVEGYMPYLGTLGGDDTSLDICIDCGQIIGWVPPTEAQLTEFAEEGQRFERGRARFPGYDGPPIEHVDNTAEVGIESGNLLDIIRERGKAPTPAGKRVDNNS